MATSFTHAVRKPMAPPAAATMNASHFRNLFVTRPTETLDANEVLFWEGDPAEHLFEITEGCLRLYKLMPDGRRAITGFMFAGEILGVSFRDRYLFTAEAVTAVKLRRYTRRQMEDNLSRMPGLSRELLAVACDELSAAQDQMLLLARKTAQERIASFLLTVAKRMSPGGIATKQIELPMARLDVADFLGLTIETVSRVLSRLKADGVIALPTSHRVVIAKPAQLRHVAGDDDAVFDAPDRTVRAAAWPN
jgi:CRP/FNR family transcriptional regulator